MKEKTTQSFSVVYNVSKHHKQAESQTEEHASHAPNLSLSKLMGNEYGL